MKKLAYFFNIILLFIISINLIQKPVFASNDSEYSIKIPITIIPCGNSSPGLLGGSGCPEGMNERYNDLYQRYQELGLYSFEKEQCANDYADFLTNPMKLHYFVEDPEITVQGKSNERARQFISWVINRSAIDDHPVLKEVWGVSRNVAFFLVLLVAAILGLGIIISRKTNFQTSIQVWPALKKIALSLLYIAFSASIVLLLIQMSEILMKFFIENLGGRDLFNIYFSDNSREKNYLSWVGCRDLNIRVQESIQSERFLLNLTNITYYVMGTMLLLRKILLWFLLFVSPFLAILMPFVLIKNIGWIWIGVFFQWLFYGPLFALFLGALSKIWKSGIPFTFDFSRVEQAAGYVFPSGINLTYGGPAQFLTMGNNGNYIDTFIEYIISLIMLWAVVFFPWWLLRIFRDYCCDGIYAMKNILMSMYDQTHSGPNPSPPSITPKQPSTFSTGISMKIPQNTSIKSSIKLETIEEIRKTRTEDISKSLNLSTTKLTDIARFETNKQTNETVRKNLDYLANPTHAGTPNERQKYMNIRTELFSRAIKEDHVAKQILSSISSSRVEQVNKRQEFVKNVSSITSSNQITAQQTNVPSMKVGAVSSTFVNSITNNSSLVNHIASNSNQSVAQVQTILTSYKQSVNQSPTNIINTITNSTGIKKEQVKDVLNQVSQAVNNEETINNNVATTNNISAEQVKTVVETYKQTTTQTPEQQVETITKQTGLNKQKVEQVLKHVTTAYKNKEDIRKISQEVAAKENVKVEEVEKIVNAQISLATEPEKHIEQTVTIPPSISLEDYEEVKKMWISQYEKGEVPTTENISTREEWVNKDVVFVTNTLNKLLSANEEMKQQGLDDLGYILPIFLINNLKGEELIVYLKAKVEAAKQVAEQIDREKQIMSKLQKKDEGEFVEVNRPKTVTAAKTMTVQDSMELPEEKKEKSAQKNQPQNPDMQTPTPPKIAPTDEPKSTT